MRELVVNGAHKYPGANKSLGAIADAEEGELGPLLELTHDDVVRPPLHDDPPWHEAAGSVSTPTQPLLYASPVSLDLG